MAPNYQKLKGTNDTTSQLTGDVLALANAQMAANSADTLTTRIWKTTDDAKSKSSRKWSRWSNSTRTRPRKTIPKFVHASNALSNSANDRLTANGLHRRSPTIRSWRTPPAA